MEANPENNGLTPQQERAAYMLASGAGVNQVAEELGIHRSTLWHWRQLPTFEAIYNRLLSDIKADVKDGLQGMYEQALNTVRRCLDSENESIALKAALQIIERVEAASPGETNPREIIRERCTQDDLAVLLAEGQLDEHAYQAVCNEYGIEP